MTRLVQCDGLAISSFKFCKLIFIMYLEKGNWWLFGRHEIHLKSILCNDIVKKSVVIYTL